MENSNRKEHTFSQIVADSAIQGLLQNIRKHQVTKVLAVTAQKEMARQFMLTQQNKCLQLCPNMKYHRFAPLKEDKGLMMTIKEPIRPLSATCNKIRVKRQSRSSINSQKKLRKNGSNNMISLLKESATSIFSNSSKIQKANLNRTHCKFKDQQKCLKIPTEYDQEEQPEIQRLREQKQKEQIQNNKRQNFFETIVTDNKLFQKTQTKFMSSIGQKDITYSYKGEVIELKKRKAFAKTNGTSRILFQDRENKKDRPFTAKTISIAYKPSQGKRRQQTRQTEILDCQDYTQKNFKASQHTKFIVIR